MFAGRNKLFALLCAPCISRLLFTLVFHYYYYHYYRYNHYTNALYARVRFFRNVKKLNSLKQCLTATRPTSHNKNSKNQKGAVSPLNTVLLWQHVAIMSTLSNTTFLIFAVLVV